MKNIRIGINGFGRMGRLALRAAWAWPGIEFVHINEIATHAEGSAHLLKFDSVHGRWSENPIAEEDHIRIGSQVLGYTRNKDIQDTPWGDMDLDVVIEATGKFRTRAQLQAYLDQGVKQVIVAAPMKESIKNIVMGINYGVFTPRKDPIITAASCTTNALAPLVQVMHQGIGIKHGMITTLHDLTNTQKIVDHGHADLRRARSALESLIPTTTGSATAIGSIFPELNGKLNGVAVRVPLTNASLVDLVFEAQRPTDVAQVNALFKAAASGSLRGILGYEERPLVSVDFKGISLSSVVDAPSTMVVNDTQVKVLAWYDNEIGYVTRMMELAQRVALDNRSA